MRYQILFCIFLILSSCTLTTNYINRKEDIHDGKTKLFQFYNLVQSKNFDDLDNMVSDSLKKLTDSKTISRMAKTTFDKMGPYQDFVISNTFTVRRESGTSSETLYRFAIKAVYEKGSRNEEIDFIKNNNSAIKITTYIIPF